MINIIQFLKRNYYLASAILIFLSFPSYDIWIFKGYTFFAWISLVPLFIFIRGRKGKEVYLFSFIIGLISMFLTYRWIGHFAGKIEGGYSLIVSMLIPFISVFFALRIFLAEILSRRFERLRFLIFPSVWIFIDWVASIGYLAFPWTYWGYSQYQFTSFIQISSVIGILGVNFFLIAANYVASEIIGKILIDKNRLNESLRLPEFKRFAAALFILIGLVIYGKILLLSNDKPVKRGLRVSVVQSCISPWEHWIRNKFKYLDELKLYTEKSISEDPDLVIWSESATLETISDNFVKGIKNSFDEKVFELVKTMNRPLLTGEIGVFEENIGGRTGRYPQNNAVLISRDGNVKKTYPKINLVPFGEWFPYEKWFPAVKKIASKYGGSDFIPGKGPLLFNINEKNFGVLICYEGIFYRLCRDYKRMGADFFINITNDGWTDTFNGHMQHFSSSIFRAIENGIWYVRAGNTGYSAIIDPYGRVVKSIPILKKGYLIGDIDISLNKETFYSKFGDLFFYLTIVFLFILNCIYFSNLIIKIYKKSEK